MTTTGTILAGWAVAGITPDVPCWMGGYGARTAPAECVHDPLSAQALALGSATEPLVLVISDLLSVDRAMVQEVRHRVMTGLPGATVWLGATHTHAGPDIGRLLPLPSRGPDPLIIERIVAGCVRAAVEAVAAMRPMRLGWTSGVVDGVATNRDHPGSGEEIALDLLCLFDPREDDSPALPTAILGSFPCHPTVLSADNREISADLPGAFRRQLRALIGSNPWVALATGAAGDISTRHTRQRQGFAELERLGGLLARRAYQLLSQAQPLRPGVPLVRQETIVLEPQARPTPETLETHARTLLERMEAERQAGNIAQARTLETALQGIAAARQITAAHDPALLQVEIAVAAVGELGLVAIPGELYNSLGAAIRHRTGAPVLLLGYTNGYVGYLPTREAYTTLDYEVLMSPFAPGSGERLSSAAITMLKGLLSTS
jgi:hypothetical protein